MWRLLTATAGRRAMALLQQAVLPRVAAPHERGGGTCDGEQDREGPGCHVAVVLVVSGVAGLVLEWARSPCGACLTMWLS